VTISYQHPCGYCKAGVCRLVAYQNCSCPSQVRCSLVIIHWPRDQKLKSLEK